MGKSDSELIEEIQAGSMVAFDEIMKRYQSMVFKIAYGFGKNRDNAMDLTQEIFLKAYKKLSQLQSLDRFKSWLQKIAYHEGINWMRGYKKHQVEEDFNEQVHGIITANDEGLAKAHKEQLIHCLFSLNTRYRLAVVLRYFENMSIREISDVMSCSEGMVKNLLFRSLCRLKKDLQA